MNMAGSNQQNGFDGPITQELHLKMSKKIAQLTKVVYALNTKNDEHDAHISCLQEAHEVELKKVLSSAETHVTKLQAVVSQQRNDKEIIVELKKRISEYETNCNNAVREFKDFKVRVSEQERDLRHGYEDQMKSLKTELDVLREDYRQKTAELSDKANQNDCSSSMLLAMKEKHEKEIELLKEVYENQKLDLQKDRSRLVQKHTEEIDSLKKKHKEELGNIVNNEKTSLTTLYKTQISQLEEEVSTLKELMETEEERSSNKLKTLHKQLEETESKFAKYTVEHELLEKENEKLQAEVNDLEEKFMESTRNLDMALQRCAEVEAELRDQRAAALKQAEDNLHKAGQIGLLDELQQAHTLEIERLQFEIKKLQDRISEKDVEIKSIKEKHSKIISIWEDKAKALKGDIVVKDEEIDRLKAEHQLSLEEHITKASEREAELESEKVAAVKQIKETSEREIEEVLEMSRANSQAIREALEAEAHSEKEALKFSYEEKLTAVTNERNDLDARVIALTAEVDQLTSRISNNQQFLSETERGRMELNTKISEQQKHLEMIHTELKDKVALLQSLRKEFDKEVEGHALTKRSREEYASDLVSKKQAELDGYWCSKLKSELEALENELSRRQSQSRNSEIKRIKDTHLQEFLEAEHTWKEKVKVLEEKIVQLEKQINILNVEALKKEMSLSERSKHEYEELTMKLNNLRIEHQQNIKELEDQHKEALQRQEETLKRDNKNMTDKLVLSHRQNMHEITKANKLSVDALKDQFEQQRAIDLNTYKNHAKRDLDKQLIKCRKDCDEENALKIHEVTVSYDEQREELQRELEMRDREMKHYNEKIGQLQNQLTDKQLELRQHMDDLAELQRELEAMKSRFEDKSKEVLQTKQEAVIQIKKREKKLTSLHQSEIKGIHQKYSKDKEELLFKHQNEIEKLKMDLEELNNELLAADERFHNRASRPEDLQHIAELEDTILAAEERIKHLIGEKKFYELELVNRESNYNKVFNSSPKIGIINPMGRNNNNSKISKPRVSRADNKSTAGTAVPNVGASFSSPVLPGKGSNRKPKLVPLSPSSSSLESLVTQNLTNSTVSRAPLPPAGPTRRVIKHAFHETSEAVVAPT